MLKKLLKIFYARKKVGLVLGGGVARGLAHIGALKVFERQGLKVDYVAGTSSGALIGALYAAGISAFEMEKIALKMGWDKIVQVSLSVHGPFSSLPLIRFIERRIGKIDFEKLKMPLAIVATDLRNGEEVIIQKGSVAEAVAASSAFPGFFRPIQIGKHDLLVDGGVVNNLPVDVVKRMGADIVIAIDVVPIKAPLSSLHLDMVKILGRSIDLMLKQLSEKNRQQADFLIEPKIAEDVWHLDLKHAKQLIYEGEFAAQRIMPEIISAI